jgi:hypothetical protein
MLERKVFPVTALRVAELTRLMRLRWGPTLPEDDAGRDDLWLILQHQARLSDPRKRMLNSSQVLAPWLNERELEALLDQILRHPPQMYSADDLGARLGLTDAERTQLAIRTIGAIDCNKEQRQARRKRKNRERERARRAAAKSSRPPAVRSRIEIDAAILRLFLPEHPKLTISELARRAMKIRDPFVLKPNGRPLDREAVRRKLNRLADRLCERLDEETVLAPNGCRMRQIRWKRTLPTQK